MRAAVLILALTVVAWVAGSYDLAPLVEHDARQRAWQGLTAFLSAFSHPDVSRPFLLRAGGLTLTTLAMAILGICLGIAGGLVLGLLSSRSVLVADAEGGARLRRRLLCASARLVQDVLRGVPDFAWAIIVIPILGLGPMAGIVALGLNAAGILGRLYSELFDSVPARQLEPLRGVGAGRLQTLLYGLGPRVRNGALSVSLLRWECAVRNSAVIGIVGGGGLGSELFLRMGYGEYDKLLTLLFFLVALTMVSDVISQVVRRRLGQERANDVADSARRGRRMAALTGVAAGVAALAAWHVWPSGGLELTKGWGALGRMLGALATPDLSAASLGKALASTAIPLSMAFLGTLLGTLAAGVIAFPASSSFQVRSADFTGEARSFFTGVTRALVLLAARGAALVARAVPEVLWAMLLVSAFRLGTLPGMLALAIHSTGLLARLFTESVDGVSLSTLEVTYGSSGSRAKTFLYGAVPSVAQEWLANAFLQFESNVRAAIVLGIVGVGGLGFLFSFEFEFFRYQRAGTYLLLMVALAIALDRLSRSLGWVRVGTE